MRSRNARTKLVVHYLVQDDEPWEQKLAPLSYTEKQVEIREAIIKLHAFEKTVPEFIREMEEEMPEKVANNDVSTDVTYIREWLLRSSPPQDFWHYASPEGALDETEYNRLFQGGGDYPEYPAEIVPPQNPESENDIDADQQLIHELFGDSD